jgi:hypothetical protein
MRSRIALVVAFAAVLISLAVPARAGDPAPDPYPRDDVLRVDHIWSIGTHNSYHLRSPLYPSGPPDEFDYEHAPLDVQLTEQGVRKFELDVFWDVENELFVVHHVNYADQNSSCASLLVCLAILREWSLAHAGHQPIFVFIEPKGLYFPSEPYVQSDEPVCDRPAHEVCHYDALDAEVRSVLDPVGGPDLLVTPDEVRGAHATLKEAILQDGWPTLRETRSRFIVVMLDEGFDRSRYVDGNPSLAGLAMFVTSHETRDDAAVIKIDDPGSNLARIQEDVALGYVIRTRADSLNDAWVNDTTRREAALASGAQVISTDFPVPGILGNGYFAAIPGGTPSGCIPITTAGLECTPADIENPLVVPEAEGAAAAVVAIGAALALYAKRRAG